MLTSLQCPFDLLQQSSEDMVKELLYEMAIIKSEGKPIYPLEGKKDLSECFTTNENDEWELWYNDGAGKMELTIETMGNYQDKVYDFGSDLKDCRFYVHEQKYINGEWITIRKYWK